MFGSLLLLFLIGVFMFTPATLPDFKHCLLAICAALLAGFFAYFLTGEIGLEIKDDQYLVSYQDNGVLHHKWVSIDSIIFLGH